jgi:leucyl-tRNA synthetase
LGSKENIINLKKFTNGFIQKMNKNLDKFQYNVIIANFYETYNFLTKEIKKNINSDELERNYLKIISVMMPVIPHFVCECLENLNQEYQGLKWPIIEDQYLLDEKVNIVVQVNGKKRSVVNVEKDIDKDILMKKIKNDLFVKKYLTDQIIKKDIYIKNKLINLII